ncbi:MAG: hypothetical protein R3C43_09585 [Chloroflexota bacterium]
MARQTNEARLDAIREIIIRHPACRPARIARLLGLDNKTVQRALSQLEERGDLLAEDQRGRLVWFGRRSP